jgi:hypothetical protein
MHKWKISSWQIPPREEAHEGESFVGFFTPPNESVVHEDRSVVTDIQANAFSWVLIN